MATFKDIEKANSLIKTTKITRWDKKQGKEISKDYAEVNQRIKAFRMLYPEGFVRTRILSHEDGVVVMQAEAGYTDEQGAEHILGTGMAFEDKKNGLINGTSYIENCETSAVGRALGMLGIGIEMSVASYEEVSNAIAQQNAKPASRTPAQKNYICKVCGKPVTDYGNMKAGGIAKKSYADYGKVMCYNCAHAEKERRAAAEQVDAATIAQEVADALQLPFEIND